MFYAGIGSRKTPPDVLARFSQLAGELALSGWVLRSGAAGGADSAFEDGVDCALPPDKLDSAKSIFLPWPGFNERRGILASFEQWDAAFKLAETVHPAWASLGRGPRKLHARNCFQILGLDLSTPVTFVACWTSDGAQREIERNSKTGGTGTAIVLADRNKIPVINFAREDAESRLKAILQNSNQTVDAATQESLDQPPVSFFAGLIRGPTAPSVHRGPYSRHR